MTGFKQGTLIYENKLAHETDVADFRLEGDGALSFPRARMRIEGTRDPEEGQAANIVLWCDEDIPDSVVISWDFYPIAEPGLCILFFAARGRNGEDVFSPSLKRRTGEYDQYHHGDIDALHVSYFRRKAASERAFQTCNLRKSYGFHLVAQGADPLPSIPDAVPPYRMAVLKSGPRVAFSVAQAAKEPIVVFDWQDDGQSWGGPPLSAGKIGFRQMTPMIAEYANLKVHQLEEG